MNEKIEIAKQLCEWAGEIRKSSYNDKDELKARILENIALEFLRLGEADAQTIKKILSLSGEKREFSFSASMELIKSFFNFKLFPASIPRKKPN